MSIATLRPLRVGPPVTLVREAGGAGHWVTIGGDEDEPGHGVHIFISSGGTVEKGPRGLLGHHIGGVASHPSAGKVTHHPVGHDPAGARDHPHYAEAEPRPAVPTGEAGEQEPAKRLGRPYARLHGADQGARHERIGSAVQQAREQAKAAKGATPEATAADTAVAHQQAQAELAQYRAGKDRSPNPWAPHLSPPVGDAKDKELAEKATRAQLAHQAVQAQQQQEQATAQQQTTHEQAKEMVRLKQAVGGRREAIDGPAITPLAPQPTPAMPATAPLPPTAYRLPPITKEHIQAKVMRGEHLTREEKGFVLNGYRMPKPKPEEPIAPQKSAQEPSGTVDEDALGHFSGHLGFPKREQALRDALAKGAPLTHKSKPLNAATRDAVRAAVGEWDSQSGTVTPDDYRQQHADERQARQQAAAADYQKRTAEGRAGHAVAHANFQKEQERVRALQAKAEPTGAFTAPQKATGDAAHADLDASAAFERHREALLGEHPDIKAHLDAQTSHSGEAERWLHNEARTRLTSQQKAISPVLRNAQPYPKPQLPEAGVAKAEDERKAAADREAVKVATRRMTDAAVERGRLAREKHGIPAPTSTSGETTPAFTAPQTAQTTPAPASRADVHQRLSALKDAALSSGYDRKQAQSALDGLSKAYEGYDKAGRSQLNADIAGRHHDAAKDTAQRLLTSNLSTGNPTEVAYSRALHHLAQDALGHAHHSLSEAEGRVGPAAAPQQGSFGEQPSSGPTQHKAAQPGDPIQPERAKPVGQLGMFGEHKPFEQPKPKSEAEQAARGGQKSLFGSSLGNPNERQPAQSHAEHEAQLAKRSTDEQGARDAADRERFTQDLGPAHPADRADWSHLLASTDGRVALKHMLNLAEGHLRLRVKEPQNALGHLTRLQRLLDENDMNTARGPQTTQLMHHPLAQMTPQLNRVARMAHEADQRRVAKGLPEPRATVQTGFDPAATERLKQESERAHAAAKGAGMEPTTPAGPTPIAERPKDFKKASEGARPHEMSEGDFIAQQHGNARVQAERSKAHFERELAAMTPKVRAGNRGQMAESSHRFWSKQVANWPQTPTEARKEESRKAYAEHVKTALSKGHPVPEAVIAQRPEFGKAQDARARYDKGRHTSFANDSVAVNRTGQQASGYKVKRQDGKPIPAHQVAEIDKGMQQIQGITGPLTEHMRAQDLTIAHLNGKHPFMSAHAAAMYHGGEQTISHNQGTLAHEMFHYMDHHAGKAQGVANRDYTKEGRLRGTNSYMSDRDAHMFDSKDPGARALHRDAVRHMTDTRRVEALMKPTATKDLEGNQKKDMLELKSRLGPYWREPREVFARLAEQYVAHRLGQGSIAADAPDYYHETPGWWSKEHFERMKPEVERQIGRRLEAMGLDASHLRGETKAREAATCHGHRGRFVAPIAAAAR